MAESVSPLPSAQVLLAEYQPRLDEVKISLRTELEKIGLAEKGRGMDAPFSGTEVVTDPFDQSQTLTGFWMSPLGMKQGSVQLLENGQAFAEYDVLIQHPDKPKWFIEAVTAWGKAGQLKSELRLIPVP
jgi:hypothetical protein